MSGFERNGEPVRVCRCLFLKLLLLLAVLPLLLSLFFAHSLKNPDSFLFHYTLVLVGLVVFAVIAFLTIPVFFFFLFKGGWPPFFKNLVGKAIVFLFPLILMIGKVLGLAEDRIRRSFIELNNYLVAENHPKVTPGELLLLLPHCLQDHRCPHKITRDPFNCHFCGRCPIGELLRLAEKWKVEVAVVPGGTLARSAVSTKKPHMIVAAACERDLSSGIIDSFPLPVLGTLLERPFGPCFNTSVSICQLEDNLKKLLLPERNDTAGPVKRGS